MYSEKTVCYILSRAQIIVMIYEPGASDWAHKWNYQRNERGQKSAERKIQKMKAEGYAFIGEKKWGIFA